MVAVLLCFLAMARSQMPDLLPPPDEATRSAWRESLRLEQAGDFAGALVALRPSPPGYATSLRQGWLEYLAGNYLVSSERYDNAVHLAPRSLEARLGFLLPLLARGRNTQAEQVAREILRESPQHPLAQARLAVALRQQHQLTEAERTVTAALKSHPTDVALLNELALVHAARQRLPAARQLFNEVITLDPDNAVAHAQLANPRRFADRASATRPARAGGSGLAAGLATDQAPHAEATAYFGGITYDHATYKDHAWLGGVNGWLELHPRHVVEAGVDYLDLAYQSLPSLQQLDATAAYGNFCVPNLKLRLGGHYLTTTDEPTDGGWVVFGGADWFAGPRWRLGLDGFFSRYPDYAPSLDAVQLTPRLQVDLAQGPDWSWRADLAGYWIQLGRALPGLDRQNFFSGEGRLSLVWRRWTFSGFGWAGNQAFAVRNSGYTVFNLAEEHTAGYGAEIQRALSGRLSAGLRFQREQFREIFTTASAAENLFLAKFGLTF